MSYKSMTTGRVHVNWIRLCFVHTDDCNVIMFNATIWFDGSSLMIGYMIIVSSQKHDNNIYFLCRDSVSVPLRYKSSLSSIDFYKQY